MTTSRPAAAASMRAVVLEQFGGPLTLSELATPAAGPGQVLVRVAASGVNPLDTKIRAGKAAHARSRLPAVLGVDLAGVVEAVGPEVTGFTPGDEVYGLTGGVGELQGSLAEYAAVDARLLAHKPVSLSPREAAALPLTVITAWEGLVDRAQVKTGQRVLVHGGAGGIGHVAIQIARARGPRSSQPDQPAAWRPSPALEQRRSTTPPPRSRTTSPGTPAVRASTSSSTPSAAKRSTPPSPRYAPTPVMWSAPWVGAPTALRPCRSAGPHTRASSRCCRC